MLHAPRKCAIKENYRMVQGMHDVKTLVWPKPDDPENDVARQHHGSRVGDEEREVFFSLQLIGAGEWK